MALKLFDENTSDVRVSGNTLIRPEIWIPALLGIFFGIILTASSYAAAGMMAGLLLFLVVFRTPVYALAILVMLLPFSGMEALNQPVVSLPGAKPLQMLGVFVIFIALLNYRSARRLAPFEFKFIVFVVVIFAIAMFRSLFYLDVLNELRDEQSNAFNYLLSYLFKPLIYILPTIIIARFARRVVQLRFVVTSMIFSLVLLSLIFLYIYFTQVANKLDFELGSEYVSGILGLHKNAMATFYIIAIPFFIARYFHHKSIFNLATLLISTIAIGFLFSRTAYLTLVLSFILYLFISGRAKMLPVLLVIGIGLSFTVSSVIIERASKGLGKGEDLNEMSAGRIDRLWGPLFEEYMGRPDKLIIGNGRFGILTSKSSKQGLLLPASHPHNMYIEQVLDSGIVGLCLQLFFFASILLMARATIGKITNRELREYQYAVIVSLLAYGLAGMTGRSMFPTQENCYLWIVFGIAFVTAKMVSEPGDSPYGQT